MVKIKKKSRQIQTSAVKIKMFVWRQIQNQNAPVGSRNEFHGIVEHMSDINLIVKRNTLTSVPLFNMCLFTILAYLTGLSTNSFYCSCSCFLRLMVV